ncbi:MAG TPA: VapE domain-containing protein [Methylophilaceae bacterium]|nr:VapE domain-containing protein [Methylophilaceae bacterium]
MAPQLVESWLPGGKYRGREYLIGDLRGSPGESLSINVDTGKWCDFAAGMRGGDMISLYAAINSLSQIDAARRLAEDHHVASAPARPVARAAEPTMRLGKPPQGTPVPTRYRRQSGGRAGEMVDLVVDVLDAYPDVDGQPIMYIGRIEARGDRSKVIVQLSWNLDAGEWWGAGFPDPRPLFGLDLLAARPDAPVMVVEGEKTAKAARSLIGHAYVVVTWPGGTNAWQKADWTPLHGRKALFFPDADAPGVNCMGSIIRAHHEKLKQTKVVDTTGMPEGWDLADAVTEGWTTAKLVEWAKPRAKGYVPVAAAPAPVSVPAPVVPDVQVTVMKPQVIEAEESDDVDPLPGSAFAAQADLGLAVNNKGTPHANLDNMARILKNWEPFRHICWFDTFHQRKFTKRGGKVREWTEEDDIAITEIVQRDIGIARMGLETVRQAIQKMAMAQPKDEPRDWMKSLVWDGVKRISRFCPDYLGSADTEYARGVGRNFFVSMVARTFKPGCKVDNMLVLEGAQGARKSTALEAVGGAWFCEVAAEIGSQKFIEQIQGKLLVEIAELDSLNKADVSKIKQAITCRDDRFRPSYGRYAKDHPRRCVFTGSTNEDRYLRDSTGARRFWPIKCGTVDAAKIKADREQMFAEAVAEFMANSDWYQMPGEETAREQESRRSADSWEEILADYLEPRRAREMTMSAILQEAMGMDPMKQTRAEQQRAAGCMRVLGWVCEQKWVDGASRRVWKKVKR